MKKRFTEEQFQKALKVPLVPFMQQRGYNLIQKSNEYRWKDHDSFVVSNNKWHWFSRGMGGNVISLLTRVENMDMVDAVLLLNEDELNNHYESIPLTNNQDYHKRTSQNIELISPNKNETNKHIVAYLNQIRGISMNILYDAINRKQLYENKEFYATTCTNIDEDGVIHQKSLKIIDTPTLQKLQKFGLIENVNKNIFGMVLCEDKKKNIKYMVVENANIATLDDLKKQNFIEKYSIVYNCVFAGTDDSGVLRFASLRGASQYSTFKKDLINSNKEYVPIMQGRSNTVYVFEAPIDMYSHATLFESSGLDWKKDYRLFLSGVSPIALDHFLESHTNINNIGFCLDNDETGHDTAKKFMEIYSDRGYNVKAFFPKTKDYNQDLINWRSNPVKPYYIVKHIPSISQISDDEIEL
jgi:hypothetical protein